MNPILQWFFASDCYGVNTINLALMQSMVGRAGKFKCPPDDTLGYSGCIGIKWVFGITYLAAEQSQTRYGFIPIGHLMFENQNVKVEEVYDRNAEESDAPTTLQISNQDQVQVCLQKSIFSIMLEYEDANEYGVLFISERTGFGGEWRPFVLEHRGEDDDALVLDFVYSTNYKDKGVKFLRLSNYGYYMRKVDPFWL
ncbi:B3 DNA binding domain-containing protein [Artemisia annua]|uniref:B3 DNA binding domain-containing protein n=1 Tax=Artemisia annua TaxID=35608 RepID=A0A2U1NRW1_ARTAN|nr:B3 DNA binding domain-containing protein [Artemisia annua]